MELNAFLKAVIDSDPMPVVMCGMDHTIVYMNAPIIYEPVHHTYMTLGEVIAPAFKVGSKLK